MSLIGIICNLIIRLSETAGMNYGHKSFIILFTEISVSGKSTIADLLEQCLFENKVRTFNRYGDQIRKGINKDLSFRSEDLRKICKGSENYQDL